MFAPALKDFQLHTGRQVFTTFVAPWMHIVKHSLTFLISNSDIIFNDSEFLDELNHQLLKCLWVIFY